MVEYIERNKVLAKAAPVEGCFSDMISAYDVASIPASDVVEVKHGRWAFDEVEMERYCSVCGHNAPIGMSSYILHKYCPNCGARMDGE